MHKLCFIGLGNPGSKYDNTRHNIGKDWLIKLSESYCDNFSKKSKLEAEITQSRSDEILWIIPDNYVNNSGKTCLLYTSPSPRDNKASRMPSSA